MGVFLHRLRKGFLSRNLSEAPNVLTKGVRGLVMGTLAVGD